METRTVNCQIIIEFQAVKIFVRDIARGGDS